MDNIRIAQSEVMDAAKAVKSIKEQLSGIDAHLILFFFSPTESYQVDTVSREMALAFPGIHTVGCTSAGEMVNNKMGKDSIVAMALGRDTMKFLQIEVLENLKADVAGSVNKAFKSFEKSLGISMHDLDPDKYAGMLLVDGLSGCEEELNDRLGDHTNVPFVGGSSGANVMFDSIRLFLDGRAYTDAAILILMEPANGYTILKTQSMVTTDKKLMPTKVNEKNREIIEFNGKPAAEVLAGTVGLSLDELSGQNFGEYPLGLVFDEKNLFVRSPRKIEGTSILCYCAVKEGLELTLLKPEDIVENTRADLQKYSEIKAIIDFNCAQRNWELERKNELQAYSEIFGNVPAIGWGTFGESYIGHMNQTSTMLLLK